MRRSALTLALVGILALGGCGGEASPKPAPLTPTSTDSTASPQAFVAAFVGELNGASSSLVTTSWRTMFTSACQYCVSVADQLDQIRDDGGAFESSGLKVRRSTASPSSSGDTTVTASVTVPPQTVRYKRGGKVERFDGVDPATYVFTLNRRGTSWVVVKMERGE